MCDYSIFYKRNLPVEEDWGDDQWDIFVSAYSPTERVTFTFNKSIADDKHWIVFPDYNYSDDELPETDFYRSHEQNEAEFINNYWQWAARRTDWAEKKICIDITGFLRHYLIFLIKWLEYNGIKKFDVIYSEPKIYSNRENTAFSDNAIKEVRQIEGFEGVHSTDTSKDVMIIGVGYEEHLIQHAAENKANARKIQIYGFPSLSADMYQENILKAYKAEEEVGAGSETFFSPANDPFITANVLSDIVGDLRERKKITNLYMCPLSTKAQALGFAIYYIKECKNLPASIIYPFCETYSKETSSGILRIWKYTIEL